MLSTLEVESPSVTEHNLELGRVPVNGYESARPELDAATGPVKAALRIADTFVFAQAFYQPIRRTS